MLNFHLSVVQQIAILALQLGVIIFAARICGDLAKKIKMPSVLGELLAGIIIGPCLLGGIPLPFHGMENGLFGILNSVEIAGSSIAGSAIMNNVTFQSYHSSLYAIATIGSVMLLFISGLETDLRMFIRYSLAGTLVGIGGVVFSFVCGAAVGVFMLGLPWMHPCTLFLGILSTATSVGITARILSEQKKIDTPEGVTTLAAAVIDDVLGIICLAVVTGIVAVPGSSADWSGIGMLAFKCIGFYLAASAIGLIIAGSVAKLLRNFKSVTVFSTLAFGIALFVSGLFEQQGLAMIIGAYVTGLSLSKTDIAFAIQRSLHPVYSFFVPVFFVVMGMLVDIRAFADWNVLKIGLLYSLLAVLAKVIGCALPALFMNFNAIGALRIGCGMIPRGEVALIIAGIGMTTIYNGEPVLNSDLFGVAIIMTLLTTVVSPPILSMILNVNRKGVRKETQNMQVIHTPFTFNSPVLTEFVLRHLMENFRKEGYMFSQLDKENGVMQVRKDNLSYALNVSDKEIVFESNPDEVEFLRAIMFETLVSLHMELKNLKDIADPGEVRQEFYAMPENTVSGGSNSHFRTVSKAVNSHGVVMKLNSADKAGVIRELCDALAGNKAVKSTEECFHEVWNREQVASTCLQDGIALPHARCRAVKKTVIAIGINHDGYEFDSIDGKPSKIFVLCLSPENANTPHIECLAAIGTILNNPENVNRILTAETPEEVCAVFKGIHL